MEQTCQNCAYFIQHYIKCKKGYSSTSWGHCYRPRVKIRKIDVPACPRYKERTQNYSQWL